MTLFIERPFLALMIAAALILLWRRDHLRLTLAAGLGWLAYFAWEQALSLGYGCAEGCNIRVDLLIIYPALAALSLAAIVRSARRGARRD